MHLFINGLNSLGNSYILSMKDLNTIDNIGTTEFYSVTTLNGVTTMTYYLEEKIDGGSTVIETKSYPFSNFSLSSFTVISALMHT